MEQPPILENSPENGEKKELSFEEQLALARALTEANNRREEYPKLHGGDFDTFAESFANLPEFREPYDKLCDEAAELRKQVDEKVADKKEFVRKLQEAGEDELAGRIAGMFGQGREYKKNKAAKKGGIFSRIFKKSE